MNRKQLSLTMMAASIAMVLGACSQGSKPESVETQTQTTQGVSQSASLSELYQQAAKALFSARPLAATSLGVDESIGSANYGQKMPSFSVEAEKSLRQSLLQVSEQLNGVDEQNLDVQQRINKQVMANIARYYAGHPDFSIGYIDTWMGLSPFVVNQINGPVYDIARSLQDGHQVKIEQDAKDYITRLNDFDKMLASVADKFEADAKQGWLPPIEILDAAVNYLQSTNSQSSAKHPLVTSFAKKLAALDGVSQQIKQTYIDEAQQAVTDAVFPAYQALAKKVLEYREQAPTESGIWAQPNGEKYYQEAIRQLGDSDLSADQIHQLGLDEVARISAQMDSILTAQGYTEGSVGERMVALSKEPRFLYEDSEQGRANLLKDVNQYITQISEKMAPYFNSQAEYDVEVRAFPKETQDSMPGGQYSPPPLDGSKPGIYWINLRDMEAVASFTLKTLTYHEATPGHHWQISLNMAQDDLPFLQRIAPYNAYVEGWALYSEQLAFEMGMYEDDPFGNLGRLQDELFRAVRLVVDTGLHHKKWTRQQAIDYMMEKTGTPFSSSKAEIERYMTWPGQALGYKMGMLTILSLRDRAQAALGERFDLAEFHDQVLIGGAVPMSVLKAKVERWIASKTTP